MEESEGSECSSKKYSTSYQTEVLCKCQLPESGDIKQWTEVICQCEIMAQNILSRPNPLTCSTYRTTSTVADLKDSKATINDLPDELLIKILSFLSFSELTHVTQNVCSRWRKLSCDVEVWRNKELRISWDYTDAQVMAILHKVPQLHTLKMHREAKASVFHTLCDSCQRLTTLHVASTQKLCPTLLRKLAYNCPNLKTLVVPSQLLRSKRSANALARMLKLQSIFINFRRNQEEPVCLRPLADGCPELQRFELSVTCVNLEDLDYFLKAKSNRLTYLTLPWTVTGKRCVVPLLTVCAATLERLELTSYNVVRDEAQEAFTALSQLFNLKILFMNYIDGCPPGVLKLAFESGGLSRLQELHLCYNEAVEDNGVEAVCKGCPELRELYMSNAYSITDDALRKIHLLKKLEILDLSGCCGLSGATIPSLTQLPALHTLLLGQMNILQLEPGFEYILNMVNLHTLNFNNGFFKTVQFDKFAGKLVNLRILELDRCEVNINLLRKLREEMPWLKVRGSPISIYDENDDDDDDSGSGIDLSEGGHESEEDENEMANGYDNEAEERHDEDWGEEIDEEDCYDAIVDLFPWIFNLYNDEDL